MTEPDRSFARGDFLSVGPSLFRRVREGGRRRARLAWLRRTRPPEVSLHGFRVAVDYQRWSKTMVEVFYRGLYEVDEVEVLRRVVRPGDRVLDVGAAVGVGTMAAAEVVGSDRVWAVEANPELIALADRNFALNGLSPTLIHAAVVPDAHTEDTAQLFLHEHFWSNALFAKVSDARPVSVPARRISELVQELQPNVLVLDVEGLERDLVLGTDMSPVQVLIIETHARYAGRRAASDIVAYGLEQGFAIDLVDGVGETLVLTKRLP